MAGCRIWTESELDYLQDKWGVVSIKYIANILGRSINGVKTKAQKLKLGRHLHSGEYITLNQLADAIGIHYNIIRDKWIKHDFPYSLKVSCKSQKYKICYIDKFWKWAEQHKDILNFARFEKDILGKEPAWVGEKRRADMKNPDKVCHNRPWTKSEDAMLLSMLKAYRYTYRDISRAIGRTEGAIRRRIIDLKLPYRAIRSKVRLWKYEETQKLIELHKKGYGIDLIGEEIGRTGEQVRSKLERLIKEGIA